MIPIILGVVIVIMLAILFFHLTQLQCSHDKGACYEATLLQIIDGDTVKDFDDKLISFSLVSAPKLGEKGGDDAKIFLEAICPIGSKIIVDEDDGNLQGSYDGIMAQVYCNGMSMNAEMIYNNYAVIDVRSCGASEFTFESWVESCKMKYDKFLD